MFTRKTFLVAAAAAAVLVGSAAPLMAQTQTQNFFGGSKSYGNSRLGGSISMSGSISTTRSRGVDSSNTRLDISAHAKILNSSYQVARVLANVSERQGSSPSSKGTVDVYLGNYKVWNSSIRTSGTASMSKNVSLFGGPMATFYVLGFPVTLSATAGFSGNFRVFYGLYPSSGGVGARGSAAAWAQGTVGVMVGWTYAGGGVDVTAQLAKQTVSLDAWASVTNGIRGSVRYTVQAISIKLKVWVALLFRYTKTLASYGSRQFSNVTIL